MLEMYRAPFFESSVSVYAPAPVALIMTKITQKQIAAMPTIAAIALPFRADVLFVFSLYRYSSFSLY